MKKIKTCLIILGILSITAAVVFGKPFMNYVQEELLLLGWEPIPSGTVRQQRGSWDADDRGWRYTDENGQPVKKQWKHIDGKDYYFDENGYMTTGWIKQDGKWYYLDFAGERETGWLQDGKKRYFLQKDGSMVTGWQTIGKTRYHFEEDGTLSTGWVQDENVYYYIDETGEPHTGWLIDGGKYYYMDQEGVMQTGWLEDGNSWYYLEATAPLSTAGRPWTIKTITSMKPVLCTSAGWKTAIPGTISIPRVPCRPAGLH